MSDMQSAVAAAQLRTQQVQCDDDVKTKVQNALECFTNVTDAINPIINISEAISTDVNKLKGVKVVGEFLALGSSASAKVSNVLTEHNINMKWLEATVTKTDKIKEEIEELDGKLKSHAFVYPLMHVFCDELFLDILKLKICLSSPKGTGSKAEADAKSTPELVDSKRSDGAARSNPKSSIMDTIKANPVHNLFEGTGSDGAARSNPKSSTMDTIKANAVPSLLDDGKHSDGAARSTPKSSAMDAIKAAAKIVSASNQYSDFVEEKTKINESFDKINLESPSHMIINISKISTDIEDKMASSSQLLPKWCIDQSVDHEVTKLVFIDLDPTLDHYPLVENASGVLKSFNISMQ